MARWRSREDPEVELALVQEVRNLASPLKCSRDLDPLIQRIGSARIVMLGEASHGTHEFYSWRAELSKRLIAEQGFSFLAVEGDWPDCYRVNRFLKGAPGTPTSAREALKTFHRWPNWMWANEDIAELLDQLRQHNQGLSHDQQVGFYGLDVYSLWDSLAEIGRYLRQKAPAGLPALRQALRCFEPFGEDEQEYARATVMVPTSCQEEVVRLLSDVRARLGEKDDADSEEGAFVAEQNALVVKNAETYYRTMVRGDSESWNVRDHHMAETLDRLLAHHGPGARAIVWEHNTHIGDARYTDMNDEGMVNIGQLARERYGESGVVLVGFSTYQGTVLAGQHWDGTPEEMRVPAGREGSWEQILHEIEPADKLLIFPPEPGKLMLESRGHRAIGVVYRPQYERFGNYVPTMLPRRYDALLSIDRTQALQPLFEASFTEEEVPETYPTGV